ncbi:alpha/beta fold hydrolase [Tenacibaculum sp. Bg11-29]|uniref:alpha/beta fold hydrolase n=1 Tax=Tenacibaculum sp. Bg11-29 TaxID=2058306 RepID=UPI0018E2BAB5|nr:alpha/beta fold hydrolase [Tenacibaculum sp. Bg11-29]
MNRKFHPLIAIVLLSIFNIGYSNAQKKVEKEVLKASKNWISNFNKGNTVEVGKAYTTDAVMVAKPFGTFEGRKAISKFWTPFVKSGVTDLKYTNTKIKTVSETEAIISSNWSMNVGEGIITNETWVKTNGIWQLRKDHFEVIKQFKNNSKMNKKETYVLVHAAWLGAWQWESIVKTLKENGHTVLTPDLPGHGINKTSPVDITMDDYVETLIDIVDKQDSPVILVGHSFNGITISRVAELRPEKIKSLVYLTAFLLPNKGSFFNAVQGVKGSTAVDNFYLSEDKIYALVNEEEIQNAFAHDIPKEAFNGAKPYIVPEPFAPLTYELEITETNYGQIPKYYIECTEDRAIPIEIQRAMYNGNVLKAYSIKSSHTPNFSKPDKVANILNRIGSEQQLLKKTKTILYDLKYGRINAGYRPIFNNEDDDKLFSHYFSGNGETANLHRFFTNSNQVLAHIETEKDGRKYAEMILFNLDKNGNVDTFFPTIQEVPEQQIEGLTMFDGVKTLTVNPDTNQNKIFIEKFLNDVWIGGNINTIQDFFENGKVIQHNPMVGNNVEGLFKFMQNLQKQDVALQYQKVLATFAAGDMVMTYSKGLFAGEEHLFADLFRLENGKIAEHWDVIQKK